MAERRIRVASTGGFGAPDVAEWLNPGVSREEALALTITADDPSEVDFGSEPVVYLFGDPMDAVLRRLRKTEAKDDRLRSPPLDGFPEGRFWNRISKRDIAGYYFQSHVRRWMNAAQAGADLIFVRAQSLGARTEAVLSALGVAPCAGAPELPPTVWRGLPSDRRQRLADNFVFAYQMLGALPDVFRFRDGVREALTDGPPRLILDHSGMFAVINDILSAYDAVERGEVEPFSIDDSLFRYGDIGWFIESDAAPADAAPQGFVLTHEMHEAMRPRRRIPHELAVGCPHYVPKAMSRNSILMPPPDARRFRNVIDKHFRLAPALAAKAEREIASSGVRDAYAAHIRGPGRLDGGTGWMLWRLGAEGVPYDLYFQKIDEMLEVEERPVFVFSDASEVVARLEDRYGALIRTRADSIRIEGGEGQIRAIDDEARQMGEDVIIETWMMAASRRLVHGNSNIASFVRCLNPDLDAYDIFQPVYDETEAFEPACG